MSKYLSIAITLGLAACGRGADLSELASPDDPLVSDAVISRLSFNQGASHTLRDLRYGKPFGQPPVIEGRTGVLRVQIDVDEDAWVEREVVAVLDIQGVMGSDRYAHSMLVSGDSFQGDPQSTFDFEIPSDLVHEGSFFTVSLHEVDPLDEGDPDNEDARFDLRDDPWEVRTTGSLTIRIIPIRYTAGGNNLLPDVSAEQIAQITNKIRGTYPASTLTVEVADPLDWGSTIEPSGGGWEALLTRISDMRVEESVPESTYFYGMFNAAPTEEEWCSLGGCILGLSNLGTLQDVGTRSSLGVGYTATAADTLIHEVGHAHGRQHAPCGQGVSGIDPQYPHANARLGTWGWDITSGDLFDPNDYADMMSYCSPVWVSDYTWFHLSERIAALNQPEILASALIEPIPWQSFAVEPDGTVNAVGAPRERTRAPVGVPRMVRVEDALGTHRVEAQWFEASHIEGGMLLIQTDLPSKVYLD